jgi:uncharacterized protein DUF6527
VSKSLVLRHQFVDNIPDELADGHLYVSMLHATVVHRCCCGCGLEVVTPLSPDDWQLTYDGDTISLSPSIGNWSFPCRSHYWIRQGKVMWARQWSDREVRVARSEAALGRKVDAATTSIPYPQQATEPRRRPFGWVHKILRRG